MIQEQIQFLLESFGTQLINDLRTELLNKGVEGRGGQESALAGSFKPVFKIQGNTMVWRLEAAGYWRYVESGRGTGKQPPPKAMEKMVRGMESKNGFLAIEEAKKYKKLKTTDRKIKKKSRKAEYEQAVKSLAFIMGRAIGKKGTIKRFGYKGTDFVSTVLNDGRIDMLSKNIAYNIGQGLKIEFQGIKSVGVK